MRRWVIVGALLAVASGTVVSSVEARKSSIDAVRMCATSQLKIAVVGSFAGLGEAGGYIRFTNRTSTPCRLTGWPTLIASRAGASMPARRVRTTQFGPNPNLKGVPDITLRRGMSGEAVFVGGDNPGPGKTTCPPPYRHLRVIPPGNVSGVIVSAWIPYLNGYLPACTTVWVTMVVTPAEVHGK